jgi:hypothetical protein
MMKNTAQFLLLLGLLACLFPGCKPMPPPIEEPPPSTVEIERKVELPIQPVTMEWIRSQTDPKNVMKFQYYISNQIILEVESKQENALSKEVVIFNASTKGVLMAPPKMSAGKMMLQAFFDPNNDNLFLWFAQSADGFFELDAQYGLTQYGEQNHRIIDSGVRKPRLLVDIESANITVDINTRTVEGRSIN